MAQLAEVDIQLVRAQPIMSGMEQVELAYVIVVSSMRVAEQDMQEEVERLVEDDILLVLVLIYMLGMEVRVLIHIITNVRQVHLHQVLV